MRTEDKNARQVQQGFAVERADAVAERLHQLGKQRLLRQPTRGGDLQIGLAEQLFIVKAKALDQSILALPGEQLRCVHGVSLRDGVPRCQCSAG